MTKIAAILLFPFLITQEKEFEESEEYRAQRVATVVEAAASDYSKVKELGLTQEQAISLARKFSRSGSKDLRVFNEVLPLDKVERLIQVANQHNYSRFAATNGMLTPGMKNKFNLEGKEKALKKIEAQINKELLELTRKHQREMEELLAERDTRIKRVLGPKNTKAYDDYFGKPFWYYVQRQANESLRKWPKE